MTPEEHDAIEMTEKAVRIGEECAAFLDSESVITFFDDLDRQLVDQAMAFPLAQHEERYLALAAAKTVRELRTFMRKAADQRAYNAEQLEALWKMRDKETEA